MKKGLIKFGIGLIIFIGTCIIWSQRGHLMSVSEYKRIEDFCNNKRTITGYADYFYLKHTIIRKYENKSKQHYTSCDKFNEFTYHFQIKGVEYKAKYLSGTENAEDSITIWYNINNPGENSSQDPCYEIQGKIPFNDTIFSLGCLVLFLIGAFLILGQVKQFWLWLNGKDK